MGPDSAFHRSQGSVTYRCPEPDQLSSRSCAIVFLKVPF